MTSALRFAWVLGVFAAACASYGPGGSSDAGDVAGPVDAATDSLEPSDGAPRDAGSDEAPHDGEPEADAADGLVGGGWYERPWEVSVDLHAAWGRDADDVLAVGDGGAVVRFNGRWAAPLDVGSASDLFAIDGAPGVVALAGAGGTLLVRRAGSAFTPLQTGVTATLRGVAAWSPDDLLAVGDDGTVLQVHGDQVEVQPSNTGSALLAAWRGPDGDALALDEAGGVLRRVNGVWLRTQVAHGPVRLHAAAGPDGLHVLVAGEHGFLGAFDGLAWKALLSNDATARDLGALRVLPDGEAWAAGAGGVVLRRAAGAAFDAPFALEDVLGPTLADASFEGLVVERSGAKVRGLLAGAGGALLVNRGDGWRDGSTAPGQTLRDAVALDDGRVVAVGDSGLVGVLEGGRWSALPFDEARDLDGVAPVADGSALLAGSVGALLRLDLASLVVTEVPLAVPGRVRAIGGDVFVGDGGLIGRALADGGVRVLAAPAGVGRLHAVAVCADGAGWAAGDDGVLLTVRGDEVVRVPLETFESLRAVTCASGGVVAAGDNGVVVEADGEGGRVVRRDAGVLWQAAAWRDGVAWLAGLDGRVLRGSPAAGWTSCDLPTPVGVQALVVAVDGTLLALGVNGRAFAREAP